MTIIYLFIIILSIYKSCDWIFHGMAIEIVFSNKIQKKFFSNQNIYFKMKIRDVHTLLEELQV
jgi:hypothetical protein